jgi:hypothetical protein
MANEPERPIETLLRAAAKKRRDEAGASFELHPADRRLLQGEVARRFTKPQPAARSLAALLGQLWPRFAWGVGILAVLGLSAWLLLPPSGPGKPEALLARNQPVSEAAPAKEPPAAPTATPATLALAPVPAAKAKPAQVAYAETPPPSPPTPASQPGMAPPLLAKDTTVAQDQRQTRDKLELNAPAQAADRQKNVEMQFAAPSGTPSQSPAGAVGGTYGARYGLPAKPPPPAGVPASPAESPAVAAVPQAASMALAEGSVKSADVRSDQPALQYKSLASVASANRTTLPSAATDGLSQSATNALKGANALAVTQRFVQTAPAATARALFDDKAPPARAVLASFQLEQTGSQLRILDGDGSVYSGYVQPSGIGRRERSAKAGAPAFAGAAKVPAEMLKQATASSLDSDRLSSLSYSFRVAGTNRSLNQQVVFTGDLLPATNLASSPSAQINLNIGSVLERNQNVPAQPGQLPLLNSRISGKLVIGTDKAVEINALPASP